MPLFSAYAVEERYLIGGRLASRLFHFDGPELACRRARDDVGDAFLTKGERDVALCVALPDREASVLENDEALIFEQVDYALLDLAFFFLPQRIVLISI